MYRRREGVVEVLLAHPGGPYFAQKDEGAWTIPKGEPDEGEDLFAAARREFTEETGLESTGPFIELTPIKQRGGKIVHAWAFAGDCDPAMIRSNVCLVEWPHKSGRQIEIPEIDRVEFFGLKIAKKKARMGQDGLIDELAEILAR
jgi:predicted NUDIX family NTP pyrophosphohydrolase